MKPKSPALRGIIYRITNLLTGRVYIGKSKNSFNERYAGGAWWKYTHSRELKDDYLKHGPGNFQLDIIADGMSEEDLAQIEPFLIQSHNCLHPHGYNHMIHSRKSGISEQTRQRMSEAHKGKKNSPECRLALSKALKGRPSPLRGRTFTAEHRAHISASVSGAKHGGARKTEQFDLKTGTVIATYPCAADAARAFGTHKSNISVVCRGLFRQHRGFGWRYVT